MMHGRRLEPALAACEPDIATAIQGPVDRRSVAKALLIVTELEDYTISFANGVARHHQVLLAVPSRQYARLSKWIDPAVDLRLLDWPRHRDLANLRLLRELTRLVKQERPSVIHLLSNNTLWLNFAAPFWRPTPLITTVHDVTVHPGDADTSVLPTWATSLMARQSTHLIVHGERLKKLAEQRYGKPSDRVHTISHPAIVRYAQIAQERRLAPAGSSRPFTVLLFGRIFAYKGLGTLVRAEALLTERLRDLRIVIAGRGDDPKTFRSEMGAPQRYDIRHRYIDDGEVAQLFLDADLVVLPYSEASQSGVLHVAGSFGKPVVATDVGELGSTVREQNLGLVVAPSDPASLAEAIAFLAERPGVRASLGASARAFAEGVNAPDAVGAAAAELYRRVSEPGRSDVR